MGAKDNDDLSTEVPTIAEQGFPDAVVTTWFGFAVPSATPREIVVRLNAEINAVLATEDVRERFAGAGLVPVGDPPEQFDSVSAPRCGVGPRSSRSAESGRISARPQQFRNRSEERQAFSGQNKDITVIG